MGRECVGDGVRRAGVEQMVEAWERRAHGTAMRRVDAVVSHRLPQFTESEGGGCVIQHKPNAHQGDQRRHRVGREEVAG